MNELKDLLRKHGYSINDGGGIHSFYCPDCGKNKLADKSSIRCGNCAAKKVTEEIESLKEQNKDLLEVLINIQKTRLRIHEDLSAIWRPVDEAIAKAEEQSND